MNKSKINSTKMKEKGEGRVVGGNLGPIIITWIARADFEYGIATISF